jgi:2-polyprenyl-3-methyl-5-hydroxy-6-metoxy-1,4-benzoquinol methylase
MSIRLQNPYNQNELIIQPEGLFEDDSNKFPFVNGAYRLVKDDNYTENFGYQWNKFTTTQIDKTSQNNISYTRFFAETGWDKENLKDKNILEVGSGAGRFSQIVLDYTLGNLYSVDYSNAVQANYKNNGPSDRLTLFQASIYEMPFAKAQFDKVFCMGVLQHTPNVKKSVQSLIDMARPGGEVFVDFYPIRGWWTKLHAKYILRPFTKKMNHEKLYTTIDSNIDWLIKTYQFFSRIGIGKLVNRFLPICDIDGTLSKNLTKSQLREACVLDTFDMFSPQYDQPQKVETVITWFKEMGMTSIWGGNIKYENCIATVVKGYKN